MMKNVDMSMNNANGSGTMHAVATSVNNVAADRLGSASSRLYSQTGMILRNDEPQANSVTNGPIAGYAFSDSPPNMDGATMECEDLGPMSRDRCNTWPLRRPQLDLTAQTSPIIHEEIPEEDIDLFDSSDIVDDNRLHANVSSGLVANSDTGSFSSGLPSPLLGSGQLTVSNQTSEASELSSGINSSKKSTTRRNAWGNLSYADLITQAIISSPEKRLTLSQVYEWMVQNVPYFRDKGDSNSSAGWKNSIRHNLSLHSRFTRLQNEGAGKSSWWVINPDAKPGRSPRRARSSTFDTSSKAVLEKKRRGAKKKAMEIRVAESLQAVNANPNQTSIHREIYGDGEDAMANYDGFRQRALSSGLSQSTISMPASTLSGTATDNSYDEYEFPSFLEGSQVQSLTSLATIPSDLVDRTSQINVNQDGPFHHTLSGQLLNNSDVCGRPSPVGLQQRMKDENMDDVSCADSVRSYIDLTNANRYGCGNIPVQHVQMNSGGAGIRASGMGYGPMFGGMGSPIHNWSPHAPDHHSQQVSLHHSLQQQLNSTESSLNSPLPTDLQNLAIPGYFLSHDQETFYRQDLASSPLINFGDNYS